MFLFHDPPRRPPRRTSNIIHKSTLVGQRYTMSMRDRLNQLISQRDALEAEAEAIASELTSPGPAGQPPAGIRDPLVDKEGFPRGDIDIYNVRAKRHRLAEINTDHKTIMKEIERVVLEVQSELPSFVPKKKEEEKSEAAYEPGPSKKADTQLLPFATIDEILSGSPASEAGLVDGDELIQFGRVSRAIPDALNAVPGVVRENVNLPIPLIIRRSEQVIHLRITPKAWGGRGLLGCHLTPIQN